VLKGGEPNYRVDYSSLDEPDGKRFTVFNVTQIHETSDLIGLFRMPVVFEVHYTDGTSDKLTAWIENKTHLVRVANPGRKAISYTLFDPGRNILKRVTFDKSFEELSAQALQAAAMIDRYDALLALRPAPVDEKRALLLQCYMKETFFLTKTEIIQQLAGDNTPESVALLLEAVNDADAHVRKAALLNADPIPPMLREAFEARLSDSSYLNVELALNALCNDFPEEQSYYLEITKDEVGWRGLNIRMKWLEIAIGSGQKEYLPELIACTGPRYEFETRINALSTLRKLNYLDKAVLSGAISAALHWNGKLSGTAKEVLAYFYQQDAYHDLIRNELEFLELPQKDLSVIEQALNRKN
jgi:hypothetical protein